MKHIFGVENELTLEEIESVAGGTTPIHPSLEDRTGLIRPIPICPPVRPPIATTLAIGEEGGSPYPITTLALGEEGGVPITTMALGEEGGFPTE